MSHRPRHERHVPLSLARAGLLVVSGAALVLALLGPDLACSRKYTPPQKVVLDRQELMPAPAYDVWGRSVSADEASALMRTDAGRAMLSPANGAVAIDGELLKLGEQAFYEETFGNEVFLTDVMGMVAGPVKPTSMARAILALKGGWTGNLQVTLDEDALVGGRQFRKGELVDTGLDVPAGATAPMGLTLRTEPGKVSVGVTCALCHSTIDPDSGKVIHGAPNYDLAGGLLMAMGTNTASYFTHTGIKDLAAFAGDAPRTIAGSDGKPLPLPDPEALEQAVDATLLQWPPGSFDSMTDLSAAPAQIPDSFTWGDHPYNWSGGFAAGPFRGLSVQNNNVHGLNSDALTEADAAMGRFGIDRELFIATVLQNAPSDRYRFDPAKGKLPSQHLHDVDPTPGQPGLNEQVALPQYPHASLIEPTGLWSSDPKFPVWQKINAMSAWQNTLVPPASKFASRTDPATAERGRQVFDKAGCAACHAGPALTNNRVVPAPEIGTQPVRAKGLANSQGAWTWDAMAYAFDQPVPLPARPRALRVPTAHLDKGQVTLAHGWGDSPGGYKVPSLVGLSYNAPYFHDGGVAVGADDARQAGVPVTSLAFVPPDPFNSLRAVVDRGLRQRVVEANRAHPRTRAMNVEGIGHAYWVDAEAGFTPDDQKALVLYLLTYRPPANSPFPSITPAPEAAVSVR